MNLIQSYSVPAKVIRCLSVLMVVAAICTVFLISYDFSFVDWLFVMLASLVTAVGNYGFAIIIDAAYIYTQKNVSREQAEEYAYEPRRGNYSSNVGSYDNSDARGNDALYDEIINNG